MKDLEEAAFPTIEPLVLGETPVLDRESQLQIAKLATNIGLVGEMLLKESFHSPQGDRTNFMITKLPPKDFHVFIGRVAEPINDPGLRSSALETIPINGARKLIFRCFNAQMGSLLIHGVTMGGDHGIHPLQYCAAHKIAVVWPYHSEITTGLMPLIPAKEILELRYALQNALGDVKYQIFPQ